MPKASSYRLSAKGSAREKLRETGQFWTPDWVAEAMVAYVLADEAKTLFDPAVGAGAFFRAANAISREKKAEVALRGMDIDPKALQQALEGGLQESDLEHVVIGDFVLSPPKQKFPAIVGNPPYIRHHRLSPQVKEQLKRLGFSITGELLDGRAGLHVYFLIRALSILEERGRLAFIMPADVCEGIFALKLWRWITSNFCLDAVVTFAPEATPFPNVDTNPLIFLIRRAMPKEKFLWAKCHEPMTQTLKAWMQSDFRISADNTLSVTERSLSEGLETGLSRPPMVKQPTRYVLGDLAEVVRGIATGANEFFFMTEEQAKQLGIPKKYLVAAIGRTRDVPGDEISQDIINSLKAKGRPTLLLKLDDRPLETYPKEVRRYLRLGEAKGLPKRPLISQRRPWYKMESRVAPPFLFAYLGRRNLRFIRNTAKVLPLTGFLCIYPKNNSEDHLERLWKVLNHPATIANLILVGKSYGDGAIKVEPRSLEKLPIPDSVIEKYGLLESCNSPKQLQLF